MTISEDGEIIEIIAVNKPITVEISKQDVAKSLINGLPMEQTMLLPNFLREVTHLRKLLLPTVMLSQPTSDLQLMFMARLL